MCHYQFAKHKTQINKQVVVLNMRTTMIHQIEQLIARGIPVVSIGGVQKLARTLECALLGF